MWKQTIDNSEEKRRPIYEICDRFQFWNWDWNWDCRTINGTGNEIGTESGIKICTDQKGFSSKTFFAGKIYLL